MSLSINEIKNILIQELNISDNSISADDPLYSAGLLDSFSLIELVSSIEKKIGKKIRPVDLTLDNFDTIQRIQNFISDISNR